MPLCFEGLFLFCIFMNNSVNYNPLYGKPGQPAWDSRDSLAMWFGKFYLNY